MTDPLENLLTEKAFAEALGVSVSTIRKYRERGLPFLRVGKRVVLDVAESVEWLKTHCRESKA